MKTVTFTEFRKNASSFFFDVENGEALIIMRHGKAIAEIVSPANRKQVKPPSWKRRGLRLITDGPGLCKAILEEREVF